MFADTRYLPSPSLPGPPVRSSCHGSLQRFREPFVFQGAVYTMAAHRTGDGSKGAKEGVISNINHRRARIHRQQLPPLRLQLSDLFFFFPFFALFIVGWGDKPEQDEVLSAPADVCNYGKIGKRNTYLMRVCACWGGQVIKENIPETGSIVVIQTCLGFSAGSTDTVLRVCRLYWF